ncbi:MAG: YlmC/YmxH family sporulation protein [Clostridia bacterium]|nr:YlmC/YmxH family sporulation protein [Clostridia bacterium]
MTVRISALGEKRAVSTKNGRELGRICDAEIDCESGRIAAVTVAKTRCFFLRKRRRVPWENISLIGEDTVLVDGEAYSEESGNGAKWKWGLFE